MSKTAFIYPGQGAQKCGMGVDFYQNSEIAKEIYDQADACLEFDLKTLCFEKNEMIHKTEYTQPAMVATSLAMTRVLMDLGLEPDITAGLSLGEYAAIAVAGGMKDLDAVWLVRKRGILMQSVVPEGVGTMCAILGMEAADVEKVLSEVDGATIANYNCPGQIVITGKTESVQEAAERLKNAGARKTMPLKVSGPFHSPLLLPAGEKLREEIDKIAIQPLQIPYVANVTAQKTEEKDQICDLLCKGLYSSVKWQQSVENMILDGVDTFIEIGPGKTLTQFVKKINPDVSTYNVSRWEDIQKVTGELC